MGEHDNAGIPLAYCLLSTASSITPGKRKISLTSFLCGLRNKYGVHPKFVHTDKDIAEIKASQAAWTSAKHQLCWWHLRKAIRARMSNAKLSTSKYHPDVAHTEFNFIDIAFAPQGRADPQDTEDLDAVEEAQPAPNPNAIPVKLTIPPGMTFPLSQPQTRTSPQPEEDDTPSRRIFCPQELHQTVIDMVERHLCAHPLIPGYSAPTPMGVRAWAVKEIYSLCVHHNLPEFWAYMWENWYRPGRWKLWARAECPEIPVLKTTMISESQYVQFPI